MGISILQVAYVPSTLEIRHLVLEEQGCSVTSALGNVQAREIARTTDFDLVVVGFSGTYECRAQIMHWFKQHFPHTPVVALLAHEQETFPNADLVTLSEDPRVWLQAPAAAQLLAARDLSPDPAAPPPATGF